MGWGGARPGSGRKKGSPPTAGTRHGNGSVSGGKGVGGPARNPGDKDAKATFPAGVVSPVPPESQNGTIPSFKTLEKRDRVERLQELRWVLAHEAKVEAVRLNAINAAEDREIGPVTQRTELTGKDGAPLAITEIRRVIIDPGHSNSASIPAAS